MSLGSIPANVLTRPWAKQSGNSGSTSGKDFPFLYRIQTDFEVLSASLKGIARLF